MLPDYYKHVKEHDNTLITKVFGVHRISLKRGKKVSDQVQVLLYVAAMHFPHIIQVEYLLISFSGTLCSHGEYVLY